jgi:alpha-beta hydrolase superfamily lysophospholipase
MPTFDGVTGRVYYKAWRGPAPSAATVVFLHGFGEHSGLYHRLGNALNGAGIDLWALDEIGHGLTEGERAVIGSVDDLVENGRRLTAIAEAAQPGRPNPGRGSRVLPGRCRHAPAVRVSAVRDPDRYAGLILSGAALSPLDWVLSLDAAAAPDLDLNPADLSSDPFYLDELAYDPLAFTSAADARSLAIVFPPAWHELAGNFGHVALPVLLVHGGNDPVVPVIHARDWAAPAGPPQL